MGGIPWRRTDCGIVIAADEYVWESETDMKKRVALSTLAALMVLAIGGVVYADPPDIKRSKLLNGQHLDKLTEAESSKATPDLEELRLDIALMEQKVDGVKGRTRHQWVGSLKALKKQYWQELAAALKVAATDEELRGQGWFTKKSTLEKVNYYMDARRNLKNDAHVHVLLDAFNETGIQGHIVYGEWAEGTYEYRVRVEMAKGNTYRGAVMSVLIEDGTPVQLAEDLVDIEGAYDFGVFTWSEYTLVRDMLLGGASLDVNDLISEVADGTSLEDALKLQEQPEQQ